MKIVYGVAGEGFGHSSRAHLIGQRLLDAGHEVLFVASERSYQYLSNYFDDKVKEIIGMFLVYNNRYLSTFKTFLFNSGKFPGTALNNFKIFRDYIEPFSPDLVITDFEPFTAFWASWNNLPLLSIDHQHLLTNCNLDDFNINLFAKLNSQLVIKLFNIKADAHIILNFFKANVKNELSVIAPPVVRSVVKEFIPTSGKHVLCYSTDNTNLEKLLSVFHKLPEQEFVIYGFNQDAHFKNCILRKRSTNGFLEDLSSCKAVIATAGFSLLSECMYFRKKMFLLPILGQYEQIVNAHYVQRLNLGYSSNKLDENALRNFLVQNDESVIPEEKILWPDNEKFFEIFDSMFNKLSNSNKRKKAEEYMVG